MPRAKKPKLPAIQQLPSGAYRVQIYLGKNPTTGKKEYDSITDPDYDTVMRWTLDHVQDRSENKKTSSNTENLTFSETIDRYISTKSAILSPATIRGYRSIQRNNLKFIMDMPLKSITQEDVQIAINNEAARCAPKTVRNHHGLISAVMSLYRPKFKLKTTFPKKEKPDIYVPTDEEVQELLNVCVGDRMEIPVVLAACCGLRRSEICALKWSDVNFKKNTLSITTAIVLNEHNDAVKKKTKSTAGKRIIPMMPPVRAALEKASEVRGENEYLTSMSLHAITKAFPHRIKKAGVNKFRFHDLRHYVVSLMLYLNIPKKYIADYVGHENENMIDQVYGHIMQDKKATFTDALAIHLSKTINIPHEIPHAK